MRESRRIAAIASRGLAASAVALATLGLASAPASAVTTLTGPSTAYTNQQVTYTLNISQSSPLQNGDVLTLANCLTGQQLGSNSYTISTDGIGGGLGSWTFTFNTPNSATTMQPCVVDFGAPVPGAITTLNVGTSSTTTTIAAPDTAKIGVATQIQVIVQSASPSTYNPTGQVVVKDINGATIQTMGLTSGPGTGQSYAYWWWTPTKAGTYTFQAFYGGDNFVSKSQSAVDTLIASPSGSNISVTSPSTMTVGVPVSLSATVYPTTVQGSVGFTLNGNPISGSIPIVNGVATTTWTPTSAGTFNLGANYMTNQGGTGSTPANSNPVTIVAGPVSTDVITLTQPGFGTWAPNGTYSLPLGSSTTFTASTLSGAPVTLTESGPCQVSGLTITVPTAGTQCNLVASSAGGPGYAPVKFGYTITTSIGQQTATVAAPMSGKLQLKRAYVLEAPGQGDTNAGQNITWTINKAAKNKGVCKLFYPNNGSVTVKMLKKGQCTVTGKAPGVPNTWAPYTVQRTYTA